MPRAKRSIQFAITRDGHSLIWRLHREQQWFTEDGWKGVAIHVKVADKVRRELVMEYPAVISQKFGYMKNELVRQNIMPAKVEGHIRQAIEAGWDPDSRGKPFTYQVEELPG